MRRFLLVESLLITVLEIYKQINFSFHVDGSQILFDYQWYAFPFQRIDLCRRIHRCLWYHHAVM